MSIRLISLDCTSCGSALKAGPQDILFICDHCGAGATLGDEGLERVESTALMPRKGRRAQVWRAAWVLETEVVVDQRVRADRRPTPGWSGSRTFWIPAFSLPLNSLTKLARALSTAAGEYGEVPHEPILGGSLSLADALTVARHLVVGDEVRKPDMLASVNVDITTTSHRLAAIPFERAGNQLKCAVTGVSVPAMV